MTVRVIAPCAGTVLPMTDCVDEVFAAEMVGPGVVVDPERVPTTVVSPVGGTLVKVHPHAFVVLDPGSGVGVLVHLGIDTVRREGAGFDVLAAQGSTVAAGDPVVHWDPAEVEAAGFSAQVPVVAMDRPKGSVTPAAEQVAAGELLFEVDA